VVGVLVDLVVPSEVFIMALDVSALGIIASWATIVSCEFQLCTVGRRRVFSSGPVSGWSARRHEPCGAGLFAVTALTCWENYWYTGSYPVVAETPLMDELINRGARQAANLPKEVGD
jgi:L-asparagine permease